MSAALPVFGAAHGAEARPISLAVSPADETRPAVASAPAGSFSAADSLQAALVERLPALRASPWWGERRMASYLDAGATLRLEAPGFALRLPDGGSLWRSAAARDAALRLAP